ncbi:MAG TPA: NAD-dependent succinate-semialdehyde dehydrogenase [Bacillaceae bacterium]
MPIYEKSIFINGEWMDAENGETVGILNPATLETVAEVSAGGRSEAEKAVLSAKQAFRSWSSKTGRERSSILYKVHELLLEHKERLARLLTQEQGKPLKEALGEIMSAASFFLWYSEEASRAYGEWLPSSVKSKRMLVMPQPVGVVAAITPWNFPSSMIARKIAPALAAGCTVVLKPAPETPLSAIEIVKLLDEAGLPAGVVNLVAGDAQEIGRVFLTHRDVRLITFTGSTAVGKYLMRESAEQVKKLSLELGGHAPVIVFEDADLELAAELTLASKFRNNGQTCICANRVYVQEGVMDAFSEKLKENAGKLLIGDGLADGTEIGPLINGKALEKVRLHVKDAVSKGASVLCGGVEWKGGFDGHFYQPTVLGNVSGDMLVMKEETFGPVIPLMPFAKEDEAIAMANDTDYGLAAYIFTENLSRSLRVSEQLEYGIVGVNDVFPAVAEAPFGGIKQSGFGKEGGHHGMSEFLEMKLVSMGIRR